MEFVSLLCLIGIISVMIDVIITIKNSTMRNMILSFYIIAYCGRHNVHVNITLQNIFCKGNYNATCFCVVISIYFRSV